MSRRSFVQKASAGVAGLTMPWAMTAGAAQNLGTSPNVRYSVYDPTLKKVIVARDADYKSHPASETKIASMILPIERIADPAVDFNLETLVKIPEIIKDLPRDAAALKKNWHSKERSLKPGDIVPAKKLMIAAGCRSCAHSTLALAIHLGNPEIYNWAGSEQDKLAQFMAATNQRVKDYGLTQSHFSNPIGLSQKQNYSTTTDIAILAAKLDRKHGDLARLVFGQATFDLSPIETIERVHTSSFFAKAKHPERVKWVKTGFTNEARYCLAVSYNREGVPLIGVVFAEASKKARNETMMKILSKGYAKLGVYNGTYKKPEPERLPSPSSPPMLLKA